MNEKEMHFFPLQQCCVGWLICCNHKYPWILIIICSSHRLKSLLYISFNGSKLIGDMLRSWPGKAWTDATELSVHATQAVLCSSTEADLSRSFLYGCVELNHFFFPVFFSVRVLGLVLLIISLWMCRAEPFFFSLCFFQYMFLA